MDCGEIKGASQTVNVLTSRENQPYILYALVVL